MTNRPVEIENPVTYDNLSLAVGIIRKLHDAHWQKANRGGGREPTGRYRLCLEIGIRAAKNRDNRLMTVLDKGAETLMAEGNVQMGGMRNPDGTSVEATEFQTWRNAYTQADKGGPDMMVYQLVYAAAALIVGYAN